MTHPLILPGRLRAKVWEVYGCVRKRHHTWGTTHIKEVKSRVMLLVLSPLNFSHFCLDLLSWSVNQYWPGSEKTALEWQASSSRRIRLNTDPCREHHTLPMKTQLIQHQKHQLILHSGFIYYSVTVGAATNRLKVQLCSWLLNWGFKHVHPSFKSPWWCLQKISLPNTQSKTQRYYGIRDKTTLKIRNKCKSSGWKIWSQTIFFFPFHHWSF